MLTFTKMHGIGNDYIYIECFTQHAPNPAALARVMADRHTGIGGDGLILVLPPEDSTHADLRMRMFNADGSESQMCGNGIRCVCKLAHDRGLCVANPMRIETGAGILTLDFDLDDDGRVSSVRVNMGAPVFEAALIPVAISGAPDNRIVDYPLEGILPSAEHAAWMADCGLDQRMTCISMGNPHAVIFCNDVDSVPLEHVGPLVERHRFFPERTNVHFAQVDDHKHITMRTWERGTGITLACGTGACAVCVAGALTERTARAVEARLPGGKLQLNWDDATDLVFMTGPATEVFTGTWSHPLPPTADSPRTSGRRLVAKAPQT